MASFTQPLEPIIQTSIFVVLMKQLFFNSKHFQIKLNENLYRRIIEWVDYNLSKPMVQTSNFFLKRLERRIPLFHCLYKLYIIIIAKNIILSMFKQLIYHNCACLT